MRGIGLVTGESGSGKTCGARKVLAAAPRRASTASSTSASPPATSWTSTRPSPGRWACPSRRNRAALFRQIRDRGHAPGLRGPLPAGPGRRRGAPPAPRRARRPAPAHQLRDGLREPTLPAAARTDRAAPATVAWPCTRRSPSASSSATTCPPSPATRCPPTSRTACVCAGTELPLFEPAAHEALFQATGGLPRKVNLLAHHALLAAALARAKTVSAEHVQAAFPEVA